MEKRIIGIILTILGVAGLIYAASTVMKTNGGAYSIKLIAVYSILGFVFLYQVLALSAIPVTGQLSTINIGLSRY